jgi:hypothetical protein
MTAAYNRRERTIVRGDAIVVPEAVALDVEPVIELLGVRHDETPPTTSASGSSRSGASSTSPCRRARREANAWPRSLPRTTCGTGCPTRSWTSMERVCSGYLATNLDIVLLLELGGKAKLMV